MKKVAICFSLLCLAAGIANAQNLIYNGGFEIPRAGDWGPDGWQHWNWSNPGSGSWVDWKSDGASISGYYVNAGNDGAWGGGGGGWFQTVTTDITPGLTYTLSVDRATENWWNPYAEMRMFFEDNNGDTISSAVQYITGHDGWGDPGLPWTTFTESAVAPEGTVAIKVEFAEPGSGGTVMFDNCSLVVVPEPGTLALAAVGGAMLWVNGRRSRRS